MKVFVHYPKNPETVRALEKNVAIVHAETAVSYIDKLPYSKDKKLELINALIREGLP